MGEGSSNFEYCGADVAFKGQLIITYTDGTVATALGMAPGEDCPVFQKILLAEDLDGDGSVTTADVILLMQYINDWDVTVDEAKVDISGDEQHL